MSSSRAFNTLLPNLYLSPTQVLMCCVVCLTFRVPQTPQGSLVVQGRHSLRTEVHGCARTSFLLGFE